MADISTDVECRIFPLVVGDAERFSAEYDWPGGVPSPSVLLTTSPTETVGVATGTLAAAGAKQTYRFTAEEAAAYTFLVLGCGLTYSSGSLTEAEFNSFWKDQVGMVMSGPDYHFIQQRSLGSAAPIDPSIIADLIRSVSFNNFGSGTDFIQGNALQNGGLSLTTMVDTYTAVAPGAQMNAYPQIQAIGWPARVLNIGALRLPGMGMN
jgi:hypothetical protein